MFFRNLVIFCALAAISLCHADKIVFKDNFAEKDALKKWRMVNRDNGAVYSVKNNALNIRHAHFEEGNGGSFIEVNVPVIKKGKLEFDVVVNASKALKADGIGLTVDLYNISTFWHDACNDWRMYFAEPVAKRLPYFNIEPVGHSKIAVVPKMKKLHYCIKFDTDSDLVEFYINDMSDPAASRYDVSVLGHAFYQPGVLRIGSYGFAPNSYETEISNIVLSETTDTVNVAAGKNNVLIFEGISSEHYPVTKLLAFPAKDVRRYTWDSPGACPNTINNYQYFKMPSFDSVENAKYIIFNDAPNVHEALQKKMLAAVKDGAKMLIMGGFFTLHKGGFAGSVLGKALPVVFSNRWSFAGNEKTPLEISGLQNKAVLYYHLNLQKSDEAEVIAYAGKVPVLLQKKYGKGSITVFTGTIGGGTDEKVFWKNGALKEIFEKALK